ncbi:zinc ribbon domain-containing protein [Candidatus Bathyarchaeota archaeon]|nr:MAG: zinc ribbon domain-containing protein [Candidatus Bathyarchaeota archaeon]
MPAQPEQVACLNCYTLVPMGTRYCPQCGNAIPPPTWPAVPSVPPAPRRNTALIVVAVVLIAVLILGIAGYALYLNHQQQVLQAAKNSEASAASNSVNQLTFTCFSNRTDSSNISGTRGSFSGYLIVYETFGISNPSSFVIDATWTIALDFPSAGWFLRNTQTFHMSPNGVAYPEFAFTITANQLNNTPTNANFTIFNVILDGSYQVTGTYATYTPTTHSTYDSTTSSGNGSLGTGSGLSKC